MPISDEIRSRITMRDAAKLYGLELNKNGFARCPFHSEKTGSFKVYDDGSFHCFGCHAHGASVIDFVMMYFSLPYKEAVSKINDDFNLGLDFHRRLSENEREKINRNALLRKKAKEMAQVRLRGLETAYNEAERKVAELRSTINNSNPRAVQGGLITQEYARAVRLLPFAEYEAEQAESELYKALHIGEKR